MKVKHLCTRVSFCFTVNSLFIFCLTNSILNVVMVICIQFGFILFRFVWTLGLFHFNLLPFYFCFFLVVLHCTGSYFCVLRAFLVAKIKIYEWHRSILLISASSLTRKLIRVHVQKNPHNILQLFYLYNDFVKTN